MLKKILGIGLSLFISLANADALKSLDNFLFNTSISSDFTQTVYGVRKNKISVGKMQIERPNKFRWEYVDDGQLIVSDGKTIYIYDKPLQQVTQKPLNDSLGKSPALLLAGGRDIKKYYNVAVLPSSESLEWVNLTPSNVSDNNGFKMVTIGFNPGNGSLSQMKFIDNFGNKSMINFSNVKVGVRAPSSTFNFTPPTGVDVIKANGN